MVFKFKFNPLTNKFDMVQAIGGGGAGLTAEAFNGSDCTGTDGAVNRTLTVTQTITTHMIVTVNGRVLHLTDEFTTSGSVITFLVPILDVMKIRVHE